MTMQIVDRIQSLITYHKLMAANERILVAVSGGADSLALLHILKSIDLPLQLMAAYIDHGLRPQETPKERKLIAKNCRALDVPFTVREVDVHGLMGRGKYSPEEAARILRYEGLEELRKQYSCDLLAVGHTADDQVEEFFLRLIRGGGRGGLSGMKLKRDHIVRPLLFEQKSQLICYLTELGVK